MKKRKPPVIPIAVLCILGTIALGINYRTGINPNAAPDTPPPATDIKVGDSRAPQSTDATRSQVVAEMSKDAKNIDSQPKTPTKPKNPMMGKGPSPIANSSLAISKPKPNESSISSQWYHNN